MHPILFVLFALGFFTLPLAPAIIVLAKKVDSAALELDSTAITESSSIYHKWTSRPDLKHDAPKPAYSVWVKGMFKTNSHSQAIAPEPHSRFFAGKDSGLTIREDDQCTGDYIANKDIVLERNAVVYGSIKSRGTVTLLEGALVSGNIVARDIEIGPRCFVAGSVLAANSLSVSSFSAVGNTKPVYLRAKTAQINSNALINGVIVQQTPDEDKTAVFTSEAAANA